MPRHFFLFREKKYVKWRCGGEREIKPIIVVRPISPLCLAPPGSKKEVADAANNACELARKKKWRKRNDVGKEELFGEVKKLHPPRQGRGGGDVGMMTGSISIFYWPAGVWLLPRFISQNTREESLFFFAKPIAKTTTKTAEAPPSSFPPFLPPGSSLGNRFRHLLLLL